MSRKIITVSWDKVRELFPDLPEDAALVDIQSFRGQPARVEFLFAIEERPAKAKKVKAQDG